MLLLNCRTLLSKLSPRVSLKTADPATATATDTAANSAPSLPRRLAAHGVAAATVAEQENAAEEDDEPELSPLDVPATATCSSSSSSSTSVASVCAAERALAQQRLLQDVSQALPTKKKKSVLSLLPFVSFFSFFHAPNLNFFSRSVKEIQKSRASKQGKHDTSLKMHFSVLCLLVRDFLL